MAILADLNKSFHEAAVKPRLWAKTSCLAEKLYCLANSDHYKTVSELLTQADIALYQA